jgi:hypothetical protein
MDDLQPMLPLEEFPGATSSGHSIRHYPPQKALGIPSAKRTLHYSDAIAAIVSIICLFIALFAVASENLSWRLGFQNRQLIVLGFLLSIMNLCLASVTPKLFLLLEARLGPSILQNFDAILRNSPTASKLSVGWRLIIIIMLALPIALSVAYKTFTGGQSAMKVDPLDYVPYASFYGMFPLPGQLYLGYRTGLSFFFNSTFPFIEASSRRINGSAPTPPVYPRTYGFNMLSLNNESTAMLDMLQPEYMAAAQELLADGESWTIHAPVISSIATMNRSKTEDPNAFESSFMNACESKNGDWEGQVMGLDNGWNLVLIQQSGVSDQSIQYIGLQMQVDGSEGTCSDILPWIHQYHINRQWCQGSWTVTRSDVRLIDASCNGTTLPPDVQTIFTTQVPVGRIYGPSLGEILAPFSSSVDGHHVINDTQGKSGNQSSWFSPSMTTSVAAMVWSRVTGLDATAKSDFAGRSLENSILDSRTQPIYSGVVYQANHTMIYIRPTLRKTGLLYLVLLIQPLLTIMTILLIMRLYTTPIDRGFGLASILSGIDRQSLDNVAGAGLSGNLARPVHLIIRPRSREGKYVMEYEVTAAPVASTKTGELRRRAVYF